MPHHRTCLHSFLQRAVAVLAIAPLLAFAQDAHDDAQDAPENFAAHFQGTYVWQKKPEMPAQYSGPNSLDAKADKGYTFSATAFLGWRLWRGGEFYWDPEAVQGMPLSGLVGLAGFTNGEAQKGAGANITVYNARAFLRQTWALGDETDGVESDLNQLAGSVAKRRVVLTLGKLSVTDVFDRNQYAADPRTRLLNWSFLTHGSFDYAADTRGYTWGAALEWIQDDWAVRAGRFLLPVQPNVQELDWAVANKHADAIEIEHAHSLAEHPGKLRLLAFRNRAVMARYEDALALAHATGTTPDLNSVRTQVHAKTGYGLALEQEITSDLGAWARINRNNGASETYAFTTIDQATAAGFVLKGTKWSRPADSIGFGVSRNALSSAHRQYLAEGGLDYFIGDGRLNYRPEWITEAYYTLAAGKHAWITFDFQQIRNPAYNADRGPAKAWGARLHAEF